VADAGDAGWRRFGTTCTLFLCFFLCGPSARAHPVPESLVWIDTTPTGLHLTAQLPLSQLAFAFGHDPLAQCTEALNAYLLRHVGVRGSGASWQVLRPRLSLTGTGPATQLQAVFDVRAPAGTADLRHPELVYDIVTHEVRTHRALVFLRADWQGGLAGRAPVLMGELRYGRTTLPIVLGAPRGAQHDAQRLFVSGVEHIAGGADHLVFLLMLVLAAPLMARRRRWMALRPRCAALRHVAGVVTAFTVGQSVTLVAGSAGWVTVPAALVGVAVAATIACAALHAWRPLFARAEAWMALGFGMVHGLAFAGSLQGAGLTPWQHAQALLAFSLGIETMQLLAVLLVLPPLLALGRARPRMLTHLRHVLAALAGVLALVWIAQRVGDLGIAAPAWLSDPGTAPLLLVAALWLLFLAGLGTAHWRERRTPR